jgi:hypothetical protein
MTHIPDKSRTFEGHARGVLADIDAYNEAVDRLLYWQKRTQQIQAELIASGIHLQNCAENPRHMKLSGQEG